MIIYNDKLKEKVMRLKKKTEIETLILELEEELDKTPEIVAKLKSLKEAISQLESSGVDDSHKKYLAEIILEEKTQFGSNNLILAPIGSGKTTLIKEVLIDKEKERSLILVSTRFLKESFSHADLVSEHPLNLKIRPRFLDSNPAVLLMTYHEFGLKIKDNNDFVKNIDKIFCDEIHSLPEYRDYNGILSDGLIKFSLEHAMKYLFNVQEGKQIFYFTATDENFEILRKRRKELVSSVKTFDFRNHPEIKRYMELSKAYISHIEQIRPFLKERIESFNYFKSKGLAFGKTIRSLKMIEKILIEEGYKPLVLWSDKSEEPMSKEQLIARKILIQTNKIPEGYNFIVMNSALREGWDLKDPSVRLAIMNTTSETDTIQARGRIRKDVDLIVYKSTEDLDKLFDSKMIEKYLNTPLTANDKNSLCADLGIKDERNRLVKWPTVQKILKENGYDIKNSKITLDKKRVLVSTISIKSGRDNSNSQ